MEEKGSEEQRRGRGRGRGRGRPRLRTKGLPRGLRVKKRNMIESEEEEEQQPPPDENQPPKAKQYDQDCDISSLEAPTFTTLDRGPPAPMLRLSWDHPVNLIGEKVLSPRIHICDSCNKPILIYGRMIPCKHVFCLWCAKSEDRVCARCGERVARVEQTGLGTVFMCNYTINKAVCKRTYLSQRDLQAHIDHRHMKMSGNTGGPKEDMKEERLSHRDPRGEGRGDPRGINDPRVGKEGFEGHTFPVPPQFARQGTLVPGQFGPGGTQPLQSPGHQGGAHVNMIPVMTSARTNLITVPIQDPSEHSGHSGSFPPNHGPPSHLPGGHNFTSPPPSTAHSAHPPPPHSTHSQSHSGHPPPQPHSAHNPPHSAHPQSHSAHSQPHSSHSQPHSQSHSGHANHSQSHSQGHSSHSQQHSQSGNHPQPSQNYPTSLASLSSAYQSQSGQYTYPPNPSSGPPPNPNVPPPPYSSVAPPPTTFAGGRQYDGQYPAPQWSNAPPQTGQSGAHTQPSHSSSHTQQSHFAPPPSSQSSQYYRKNF